MREGSHPLPPTLPHKSKKGRESNNRWGVGRGVFLGGKELMMQPPSSPSQYFDGTRIIDGRVRERHLVGAWGGEATIVYSIVGANQETGNTLVKKGGDMHAKVLVRFVKKRARRSQLPPSIPFVFLFFCFFLRKNVPFADERECHFFLSRGTAT